MKKFRLLKANEINVRVQQVKSRTDGVYGKYLLYKDARCDMNILDEEVGAENWQRHHEIIDGKLYCNVGIWFENIGWVWKQDVGTESNEEAEKGQASDAFKRACFNWGIGRELYSSPDITIKLEEKKDYFKGSNDKIIPAVKLDVADVAYDEFNNIVKLVIVDGKNEVRFNYSKEAEEAAKVNKKPVKTLDDLKNEYKLVVAKLAEINVDVKDPVVVAYVKRYTNVEIKDEMTADEFTKVNKILNSVLKNKKEKQANESNK